MTNGWGIVALFCVAGLLVGFGLMSHSCTLFATSVSMALIAVGLVVGAVYWLPIAIARMIFAREQEQMRQEQEQEQEQKKEV